MSFDAVIVLLVLLSVLAGLAFTRIAPDALLVAALTALLACPVPTDTGWTIGVVSIREALSGFSNPGMATVGVLFIIVCGMRETGAIDWIAERLFRRPKSLRRALVRIVLPVSGMSAFLNNTPVVAMLIPAIQDWSKKLKIPPSKLLIPLSYAAIMGGTCSLIGTSTNLVVNGMVISAAAAEHAATGAATLPTTGLRMFDITWVGVPALIVGTTFLLIFAPRLLPDRGSPKMILSDPREYTLELMVPEGSPLGGKTVEEAGLRNLPGCYLLEIQRGDDLIPAVGPQQVLRQGDRLVFVGVVESIRDLQNLRGLQPATSQVFKLDSPRYRRRLFEAVVSPSAPVAGKSVREGRFRNRYKGAIVAVARNGERVRGKVGDIVLRGGDVLLVEAEPGFAEQHRNSRDFLLVSALEDSTPRRHGRAPIAVLILIAMVAAATSGIVDMLVAAMVAAGIMIFTRCCTISEARRSVDWSVLIVIGAALGLGGAMQSSGLAQNIASGLIAVAGSHPWLVLIAVYFVTSMTTEVVTNNAAVALMFPIAYVTSIELDVNFMPFAIAIMMAGSASFATPLGYQTNLMVYGPGGYRLKDFLRIGLPMNILIGLVTIILTPLLWSF